MPLVGGGVAGDHFERLNERVLEKIGVKIGPYWHLGFLVFFEILTILNDYSLNCEVAPIKFRPPKLSGKEHQNLDLQSLRI